MIMYEFPSFGQNPIYLVVDVHKYLWVLNEDLKSQVHIFTIFFRSSSEIASGTG